MIYLTLALYLFSLAIYYDFGHKRRGMMFHYLLSYILMVSLLTFRYRVGGDTLNYMFHFENTIPKIDELDLFTSLKFQPIPATIFSLCKTFFNDFTYVQAIFAFFVNAVVFSFFKKHTRYFFTAIFLYGLTFFMRLNCEVVRESLAVAFFLLAYPYMLNQKYFRFFLFTLLAFLCHSSAIFTFFLPFFLITKNKRNWFILFAVFTVVALYVVNNLQFYKSITYYAEAYADYESSIFGKLRIIIFNMLIPAYFLYNSKKWLSSTIKTGVMIYIGCSFVSLFFYIAYRFNNYLMIFYIMMVAEYLNRIRNSKTRDFSFIRMTIVSGIFLYSFMSPYFSDVSKYVGHKAKWYCVWYPYYSIFDPQTDADRESFIMNQGK